MRAGVLQRIFSRLLIVTAVAQAVPLVLALVFRERIWFAYLVPMVLAGLFAHALRRLPAAKKASTETLRRREGFVAVVGGWMVLVFFGAIAFHLTGYFQGFAWSFFESMSGYTTTGATVLPHLSKLPEEGGIIYLVPRSLLFVRAFSHWIGGMGIIVLSVAILPELAVGGMQLFSAEASGIESDKLAPRIGATARRLWVLYVGLTVAECGMLLAGGMSFFESVLHSLATIATGGFSTRDASVGGFGSVYIEMVILVFMFLSGISFTLQYRAFFQRQPGRLFRSPEVRLYTSITLLAIALITINLLVTGKYRGPIEALRYASFQTVAIITTTGFSTADFGDWPAFSQVVLVALMLLGGCAGSTAGGSKVVRLYVVAKHAIMQLRRLIRPRLVQSLRIGDKEVSRETTEGVLGYYLLYFAMLGIGFLILTGLGMDLVSGTTASISALNSIGPGLGTVGPTQNFAAVHPVGLYVLSFMMLLGRLEIFTVLVLFSAHFWRRG